MSSKGVPYLRLLDNARCNGAWNEVPELLRKLRKHAPDRKSLLSVAQCEHDVALHLRSRPPTAASEKPPNLTNLTTRLDEVIENESRLEELLQAQVCQGWVQFSLNDYAAAASQIPPSLPQKVLEQREAHEVTGWTAVCAVKGAFLKGLSQERLSKTREALESFLPALPLILLVEQASSSPESRYWSEQLLGHCCLLTNQIAGSTKQQPAVLNALGAFRAWARFWEPKSGQSIATLGGVGAGKGFLRRHVWRAYYTTLSSLLTHGLAYAPPKAIPSSQDPKDAELSNIPNVRFQQRTELQRVQSTYEGILLGEVPFPKANEYNHEIGDWVDIVMNDWAILCGPSWCDDDLGEGGKDALGRNTLDILYRAATKSFHSTSILRHLFVVHKALAEFDLAFKAFDTYLEIVIKGKSRAEKAGEAEPGLDDNETLLQTLGDAITALCRYGGRKEAERASELAALMETWLIFHFPESKAHDLSTFNGQVLEETQRSTIQETVSRKAVAAAYRAIGVGEAHWARTTYDAPSRAGLRAQAIKHLQLSLSPEFEDSKSVDTFFALGLLQAETRDLNEALKITKTALLPAPQHVSAASNEGTYPANSGSSVGERRLVPLWHLLILLLSAKEDFFTAIKSCNAAFEKFLETTGSTRHGSRKVSSETQESMQPTEGSAHGPELLGMRQNLKWHDKMEEADKEALVQLKMTHLALLEVIEGPEVALNASDELLLLYIRCFGEPGVDGLKQTTAIHTKSRVPQSSNGTSKSKAGSFFSRPRTSKALYRSGSTATTNVSKSSPDSAKRHTIATEAMIAPTIQVTDEDERPPRTAKGHRRHLSRQSSSGHGHKLHKAPGSIKRKKSTGSFRWKKQTSVNDGTDYDLRSSIDGDHAQPQEKGQTDLATRAEEPPRLRPVSITPSQVGLAVSVDVPLSSTFQSEPLESTSPSSARPLPAVSHNMPRGEQPPPLGHSHQPPYQDVRLPSTIAYSSLSIPTTRFPKSYERRQQLGLLLRIWLLFTGLYRRAAMYEDAGVALEEASKVLEIVETEALREPTSKRSQDDPGWGRGMSVDELWSDIWAERGHLSRAQTSHYEALSHFEQGVARLPDHPSSTIGLCNVLLDLYAQIVPPQQTLPNLTLRPLHPFLASHEASSNLTSLKNHEQASYTNAQQLPDPHLANGQKDSFQESRRSPLSLDRLAARDRAYGLLSSLTKLGTGWDNSDAWFALARAYEEGGQLEKAKEVLWWCVELEEGKPVRHWQWAGGNRGYVL
ncbi:MAG: hypothetical protein M1833_000108 [Piccolia ochrophora]|nr:MAG: hypothetical protein M1833_000108 [Piccolia ochrophora]